MEEGDVTTGHRPRAPDDDQSLVPTDVTDTTTNPPGTLPTVSAFPTTTFSATTTAPAPPTSLRALRAVPASPTTWSDDSPTNLFFSLVSKLCGGDWLHSLLGQPGLDPQSMKYASMGHDGEVMIDVTGFGHAVTCSPDVFQKVLSSLVGGDCAVELNIVTDDRDMVVNDSDILTNAPSWKTLDSATAHVAGDAWESRAVVPMRQDSARNELWQCCGGTVRTVTKLVTDTPEIVKSLLAAYAESQNCDGRDGQSTVVASLCSAVATVACNQMVTCFQDSALTSFRHSVDALSGMLVLRATVCVGKTDRGLSSNVGCLALCPARWKMSCLRLSESVLNVSHSRVSSLFQVSEKFSHSSFRSRCRSEASVVRPALVLSSRDVSPSSFLSVWSLRGSQLPNFPFRAPRITPDPRHGMGYLSAPVPFAFLPLSAELIGLVRRLLPFGGPQDVLLFACTLIAFIPHSFDLTHYVRNLLAMPECAASINRQGLLGYTSLMLLSSRPGIVMTLLAAGADPEIPADDGKTFLYFLLCIRPGQLSAHDLRSLVLVCIRVGVNFYRWTPSQAQSPLEVLHLNVMRDEVVLIMLREVGFFRPSHVCPPFPRVVRTRVPPQTLQLVQDVVHQPLSLRSVCRLRFVRHYRGVLGEVVQELGRKRFDAEKECEVAHITQHMARYLFFCDME